MAGKKPQQAIFLPIYLDKDGKETFQPFRIDAVGEGEEKTLTVVPNEQAKTETGKPKTKAMNRAARRIIYAQRRKEEQW
jgi:hypothetical protein